MRGVKISQLERRETIPAPDEMIVPVYKVIDEKAVDCLYSISIYDLCNAICKELENRNVTVRFMDTGIQFSKE